MFKLYIILAEPGALRYTHRNEMMLKIYYIWEVPRPLDRSRPFLTKILRDIIHPLTPSFRTVAFIVLQKICFAILATPTYRIPPIFGLNIHITNQ